MQHILNKATEKAVEKAVKKGAEQVAQKTADKLVEEASDRLTHEISGAVFGHGKAAAAGAAAGGAAVGVSLAINVLAIPFIAQGNMTAVNPKPATANGSTNASESKDNSNDEKKDAVDVKLKVSIVDTDQNKDCSPLVVEFPVDCVSISMKMILNEINIKWIEKSKSNYYLIFDGKIITQDEISIENVTNKNGIIIYFISTGEEKAANNEAKTDSGGDTAEILATAEAKSDEDVKTGENKDGKDGVNDVATENIPNGVLCLCGTPMIATTGTISQLQSSHAALPHCWMYKCENSKTISENCIVFECRNHKRNGNMNVNLCLKCSNILCKKASDYTEKDANVSHFINIIAKELISYQMQFFDKSDPIELICTKLNTLLNGNNKLQISEMYNDLNTDLNQLNSFFNTKPKDIRGEQKPEVTKKKKSLGKALSPRGKKKNNAKFKEEEEEEAKSPYHDDLRLINFANLTKDRINNHPTTVKLCQNGWYKQLVTIIINNEIFFKELKLKIGEICKNMIDEIELKKVNDSKNNVINEYNDIVVQLLLNKSFVELTADDQENGKWVKDEDVTKCSDPQCTMKKFNVKNRKHHCRICGNIVCKKHTMQVKLSCLSDKSKINANKNIQICHQCNNKGGFWYYRQTDDKTTQAFFASKLQVK